MNKGNVSLFNMIGTLKSDIMSNLMCHNIGRIISFDPNTQTADIELMQVKKFNEQYYDNILLSEVPVFIYGTPTAYITMPNLVGTNCIILTFDRNIDAFLETGEKYTPTTTRKHNITDSIALCTFRTQVDAIQNYDDEAITLYNEKVDEEGNKTAAHIKITDKLNIQNTTQNLATLIEAFLTACENITTVADESGGALTPETKQAFTDLKEQFKELLQ